VVELEIETTNPELWTDQAKAQSIMRRLDSIKASIATWRDMESKVQDLSEMVILTIEEKDSSLYQEIRQEVDKLDSSFDKLENWLNME